MSCPSINKGEISVKDMREIEQILYSGLANMKKEDKRFWDGYAMCLSNFSQAISVNIQSEKEKS